MTNWDRWQHYMKDVTSPQPFVDFGFFSLIASALQRRVWVGPNHMPLFANNYIILVGPPAVGKGKVIKPVNNLLKFHKIKTPPKKLINLEKFAAGGVKDTVTAEDEINKAKDAGTDISNSLDIANRLLKYGDSRQAAAINNAKPREDPLLFPLAGDTITFEKLVNKMAESVRFIQAKRIGASGKEENFLYKHCSMGFCLEEISSLFKRHREDVCRFFLNAFDCGDYEGDTISRGSDTVRNMFLNIFGGTTFSFLEDSFNDKLIQDGFTSRTIFVVCYKERFRKMFIPELTPEQRECEKALQDHLLALSKIYGGVKYTPEAQEYLRNWWEEEMVRTRPNISPKLDEYYGRKNVHLPKIAMATHFGETADITLPITLDEVLFAEKHLAIIERNMHYALSFAGDNPIYKLTKKIERFISSKPDGVRKLDVEIEYTLDSPTGLAGVREALEYLQATNKIMSNKNEKGAIIYKPTIKQNEEYKGS